MKRRGTVSWNERRQRWLIRATRPETEHAPAKRVDRWLTDPARYRGNWPSAAGRKAAEAALEHLVAELERDAHSARDQEKPARGIRLDRYITTRWDRWLDENTASETNPGAKLRPRTVDGYREVARTRVVPVLGHRAVASLVPADADAVVTRLRARGLSDASCRRAVVVLRSILKVAERDGLLHPGTAKLFELPSGAIAYGKSVPTATPEQIAVLLRTCSDPGLMLRTPTAAALALVAATGMRRSEALALRWDNVDIDAGTVFIGEGLTETRTGELVTGRTKSRNSVRTVALPPVMVDALSELRAHRPGTVYVAESVHSPGTPTRPSQAARVSRALLRDAGIPGGWHAVRHGVSEHLLAQGASPLLVARWLGHSPTMSLAAYAGVQAEGVLELGELLHHL